MAVFKGKWGNILSSLPPPPPIPGVSAPDRGSIKIGGQGLPGGPAAPMAADLQGEPKKASPLPLIVAAVLVLVSSLIQVFKFQLGVNFWFFVGYLLTPLLVTLTLGWDSVLQRNGRKDPWFAPSPRYSLIIRILVGLGFLLAVLHIIDIARFCGQSFVQSGAICA